MNSSKLREQNRKAKYNGTDAESWAITVFNLEEANICTIDATMNGRPVEIKSCQKYHKNGKNGIIYGRFTLNKEQHEYLVKRNGIYIFIVKHGLKYAYTAREAREIPYKRKLSWRKVFSPKELLIFDFLL